MIRTGDKVRFLNAVGGGKVTRTDNKQGLVYVEDEDGFEIPVLERECVVVPQVNEKTNFPLKNFRGESNTESATGNQSSVHLINSDSKGKSSGNNSGKTSTGLLAVKTENSLIDISEMDVVETPEGDNPNILIAFIPQKIKELHQTDFDLVLLNDSNYILLYNIVCGEENHRKALSNGLMEPNIQEVIASFNNLHLEDHAHLRIQVIAFKQAKKYKEQAVIDTEIRFNALKFLKLHSYQENEYFDDPAMIFKLQKQDELSVQMELEKLENSFQKKSSGQTDPYLEKLRTDRPQQVKKEPLQKKIGTIVEIDLHIDSLIDNKAGMSNADFLEIQLKKFHETLAEYGRFRGQKIVFIHGKGEGVLRNEILNQLKKRYKNYTWQDASFREYGFGATMVTIR